MAAARKPTRVPSRTAEEKLRAKDEREQLQAAAEALGVNPTTADEASKRAGKATTKLSADRTDLVYRYVGGGKNRIHAPGGAGYACRDPKRTYKGNPTSSTTNPDAVTCGACLRRMLKFPQLRTCLANLHAATRRSTAA